MFPSIKWLSVVLSVFVAIINFFSIRSHRSNHNRLRRHDLHSRKVDMKFPTKPTTANEFDIAACMLDSVDGIVAVSLDFLVDDRRRATGDHCAYVPVASFVLFILRLVLVCAVLTLVRKAVGAVFRSSDACSHVQIVALFYVVVFPSTLLLSVYVALDSISGSAWTATAVKMETSSIIVFCFDTWSRERFSWTVLYFVASPFVCSFFWLVCRPTAAVTTDDDGKHSAQPPYDSLFDSTTPTSAELGWASKNDLDITSGYGIGSHEIDLSAVTSSESLSAEKLQVGRVRRQYDEVGQTGVALFLYWIVWVTVYMCLGYLMNGSGLADKVTTLFLLLLSLNGLWHLIQTLTEACLQRIG